MITAWRIAKARDQDDAFSGNAASTVLAAGT